MTMRINYLNLLLLFCWDQLPLAYTLRAIH